jgi:DNA-binding transcriptional regulator YiaG
MKPKELETWRDGHGLTQEQLAKHLGVTKACISRWESGKRQIPAFLHITLKCLKVKKGGALKKEGTKKKKEVNKK